MLDFLAKKNKVPCSLGVCMCANMFVCVCFKTALSLKSFIVKRARFYGSVRGSIQAFCGQPESFRVGTETYRDLLVPCCPSQCRVTICRNYFKTQL